MDWLPKMMDWLPNLLLALACVICAVALVVVVGCFLRLRITWCRRGSISFLGFKWPWKKERKDDPAL